MLTRVWQDLEYRIAVCHFTRGVHSEHLSVPKKIQLFQFSCGCEQFHSGRSFDFLVINVCNHGEHWAVHLRPGSRLPPCRHDRFVFPLTVPCVRLPPVDWLLCGKWKVRALPPGFLRGFDFLFLDSSSWFHLINYWVLSLAGPGAGGSNSIYFLREDYEDFRDMFWGKVGFRSCVSKSKFR